MKTAFRTKTAPVLFILMIVLGSLSAVGQNEKIRKPFPPEISKKIKFGMSKSNFTDRFPEAKLENEESFRTVYSLAIGSKDVENLVFYFGTKNKNPLYEIIVNFNSESLAVSRAAELLGVANFNDEEWRYTYKKKPLWCWVYKSKIVYVARTPGTEWDTEWDDQ